MLIVIIFKNKHLTALDPGKREWVFLSQNQYTLMFVQALLEHVLHVNFKRGANNSHSISAYTQRLQDCDILHAKMKFSRYATLWQSSLDQHYFRFANRHTIYNKYIKRLKI